MSVPRACPNCGVFFLPTGSNQKYCGTRKPLTGCVAKINNRRYRLAKAKVVGSHTLMEWEELKRIFGYACARCFKKETQVELTRDHKIPITKGGTDYIDNIQPLCRPCNTRKHTKIWFASCPIKIPALVQAA